MHTLKQKWPNNTWGNILIMDIHLMTEVTLSARIDFKRQNPMSTDVQFWRLRTERVKYL